MNNNSGSGSVYDQYDISGQGLNQNKVKVEDALSYLDQVKTQFTDEPNVYTQFLDIMKDFKSQTIDTPGVITRVSRLFRGRSSLIMGFNTFLPPGFEVKVIGAKITITDPTGGTNVVMDGPEQIDNEDEDEEELPVEPQQHTVETAQGTPTPAAIVRSPALIFTSPPVNSSHEFNEAIGYVNRIKARFANKPIVYKQFLDILHTYQSTVTQQARTPQTEKCVLEAVTSLFGQEPDLLEEFRHFLPGVHGLHASQVIWDQDSNEAQADESSDEEKKEGSDSEPEEIVEAPPRKKQRGKTGVASKANRGIHNPVWKREAAIKDVVSKTSVEDLAFFDKVRRALDQRKYETFLRAINLYSVSIISATELLAMLQPVLGGHPHLLNGLRRVLDMDDEVIDAGSDSPGEQRMNSDLAHQIDYSSCKQLGVSYRSLPDTYQRPICSGRTPLCYEVLNDTWVSFPSWSSEDSSHVSSKKTQFEEHIYRTEDERFELDIIIDVNKYAIESLELVRRRMNRMSTLEQEKFRLDERLGGSSPSLMLRAIKRIYGEHASKITEGLKRNPLMTIPKVLDRLRDKEKEWREAQHAMNRVWREQTEKHMSRSLDHQTNALKNSDTKWIKAKTLLHNIEVMFDERQQRSEDGHCEDLGPHMVIQYPEDRSVIHDASDLIIHYIKRQSNIQKDEKKKIKRVLRRYVTEWFDVEDEEMSDVEDNSSPGAKKRLVDDIDEVEPAKLFGTARYRMIYGGNTLFLFFRLHQMICDRLGRLKIKHQEQMEEYNMELKISEMQVELYRKHGKSIGSHEQNASDTNNGLSSIKNPRRSPEKNYIDMMSEMKNLLDGNIEATAYEDNIRLLFPIDGYLVFTIDKLVAMVGRQLHFLATSNDGAETLKMYNKYRLNKAPSVLHHSENRTRIETEYSQTAESLFNCQNCFKIYVINEDKPIVTIELVDTETDEDGPDTERAQQSAREVLERAGSAAGGSSDEETDNNEETDEEMVVKRTDYMKENGITGRCRSRLQKKNIKIDSDSLETEKRGISKEKSVINSNKHQSPVEIARNWNLRGRLFLRRNARMRTADIAEQFISIDQASFVVAKGLRRQMARLERMHRIRKIRAGEMFAEEFGATWLAKGMVKIAMKHPDYPFIIYNRYMRKHTLSGNIGIMQ